MNKAFTRESDDEDEDDGADAPAVGIPGGRNYITPQGQQRLKDELLQLLNEERPKVVSIVSWAASNGDRSENGDYLYGKRRLREIDRRIRFLTRRLEIAEVVDIEAREATDQVFFGATVIYRRNGGEREQATIVGIDEADAHRGRISWISPMARALTKAREGDTVQLRTPGGIDEIEIEEVMYLPLED